MEQTDQCEEPETFKTVRPGLTESPPPNCAICLGSCTNKCFTDCCMHQFCFSCLLEWSKIKAECPLCKKPFKSIIYNIKSNLEYEEHVIENTGPDSADDAGDSTEFYFLPNGPRPQRHFQYRTTFTLEPGGEFAIQQFLLRHPRTNYAYIPNDRYFQNVHSRNSHRHNIEVRRNIYLNNWWVDPQPDVTGRYRECYPAYFRENPAQAHRIIPWLNRELTALLSRSLIYQIQQDILNMLCEYNVNSSQFYERLLPHLGTRTRHFIHEFYNFLRSPYDMIGYDLQSTYNRTRSPISFDLLDEDSDVHVVDDDDCVFVPNQAPEVIVINSDSSDNDSDVIIRTPTPPPFVNLVSDEEAEESDSRNNSTITATATTNISTTITTGKDMSTYANYFENPNNNHDSSSSSSSSSGGSCNNFTNSNVSINSSSSSSSSSSNISCSSSNNSINNNCIVDQQLNNTIENDQGTDNNKSPQLPIKIRLKCKNINGNGQPNIYISKEKRKRNDSTSSDSSLSSNSDNDTSSSYRSRSCSTSSSETDYKRKYVSKKKKLKSSKRSHKKSKHSKSKHKKSKHDEKERKSKHNGSKKTKKQKKLKKREKRHKKIKLEKTESLWGYYWTDSDNESYKNKTKVDQQVKVENENCYSSSNENQNSSYYTYLLPSSSSADVGGGISTPNSTSNNLLSTPNPSSQMLSSNSPVPDLNMPGPSNVTILRNDSGTLWYKPYYPSTTTTKHYDLYRSETNCSSTENSSSEIE